MAMECDSIKGGKITCLSMKKSSSFRLKLLHQIRNSQHLLLASTVDYTSLDYNINYNSLKPAFLSKCGFLFAHCSQNFGINFLTSGQTLWTGSVRKSSRHCPGSDLCLSCPVTFWFCCSARFHLCQYFQH